MSLVFRAEVKHQLLLSSEPAALWPSTIPLAFMLLRSSDSALNYTISVSAWAATAKYHRLGGLNNEYISHSSGGYRVQDEGADQRDSLLRAFFLVCRCCCLVTKSYPVLCNSMDCSPPGSSVHGISQARILEWVAISCSRGSS